MELLTTTEAAKILHVSPIRVRQLIREGKLEAKQVGRDYVIEESSLESVKTYGKAGRPAKKTENGNSQPKSSDKKPKTFGEIAKKYIGCVDSGITDLGSNKQHLEGFGTKDAEKAGILKRG